MSFVNSSIVCKYQKHQKIQKKFENCEKCKNYEIRSIAF